MKFLKNLLFILSLLMIFACAKEDKGAAKAKQPAKKVQKKNANKAPKTSVKNSAKKKAPAKTTDKATKSDNNSYWLDLQKKLKISDEQVRKLQTIQRQFTKEKNKVAKKGGANKEKAIADLRSTKDKNMKSVLGDNLFTSKRKFDKAWYGKATNK